LNLTEQERTITAKFQKEARGSILKASEQMAYDGSFDSRVEIKLIRTSEDASMMMGNEEFVMETQTRPKANTFKEVETSKATIE
jgi:hypothetical protein